MHRKFALKILSILAFVTLVMFAMASCSVLKKNKESEKKSEKTEYYEETTYNEQTSSSTSESIIVRKSDISQWFNFSHEPLFDQFGQPIPLIIEHTKNGSTERLMISGATVTGAQNKSFHQSEEKRETKTTYKSIITYKTDTTYKTQTTYVTKTKERFAFGPQSIYNILFCGIIIVLAALAFTGHWGWLKNVASKIIKYLRNH